MLRFERAHRFPAQRGPSAIVDSESRTKRREVIRVRLFKIHAAH
ncbi:hypothetical protein [Streptomyces sp. NPDC004658]